MSLPFEQNVGGLDQVSIRQLDTQLWIGCVFRRCRQKRVHGRLRQVVVLARYTMRRKIRTVGLRSWRRRPARTVGAARVFRQQVRHPFPAAGVRLRGAVASASSSVSCEARRCVLPQPVVCRFPQ